MEWISVKENPIPKTKEPFLILLNWHAFPDRDLVWFDEECDQYFNSDGKPIEEKYISHWMPFPDKPED